MRVKNNIQMDLPQPIVIGHPVHAGLSPRIMGYSIIVKSPNVTFFDSDIAQFENQLGKCICEFLMIMYSVF